MQLQESFGDAARGLAYADHIDEQRAEYLRMTRQRGRQFTPGFQVAGDFLDDVPEHRIAAGFRQQMKAANDRYAGLVQRIALAAEQDKVVHARFLETEFAPQL